MRRYRMPVLAAAFAVFGGCSGDDNPADTTDYALPFYGTWQVTSGGGDLKYILFEAERRWHILEADSLNFRSAPTGTFEADATTIDLGGVAFTYTLVGDQLGLVNRADTIGLVRNPNAPGPASWVRTAVLLDSIAVPFTPITDIGTDDSALWFGGGTGSAGSLYRIDLTTRDTSRLSVGLFVTAVEWDGSGLWCSNAFSDRLTRVNRTSGDTTATSIPIASQIYGLAWDGTRLWANSQSTRKIHVYDPASGTVVQTFNGVFGDGMAFAGGFLYICKEGMVHRCTLSPLRAASSTVVPGARAVGIAYDGSDLWVAAAIVSGPTFTYRIYRATL